MSNLTHSFGNGTGSGNLTLLENPGLCTLQTCDLTLANFMYLPTLPGNTIYAAIFGLYIIAQLYLGIRNKTWTYMIAMVLGLLFELVGYAARIMLHNSPFSNTDFIIYLVCLTVAPAFLSASIYLCLARIITIYGENLSRFRPRTYTIIFCTCDFICFLLQAIGGAQASSSNTESGVTAGRNTMLAGLIAQVVSLVLFAICCGDFALSVRKANGSTNSAYISLIDSKLFKSFLIGLFVATFTILTRSAYRVVELAGGFNSKLFVSDEAVFMIFEGIMIIIATSCLTFLHPAICFQGKWHEAKAMRMKKGGSNKVRDEESDESSVALDNMGGVRY